MTQCGALAIQVGDLDGIPDSWLWPGPALAICDALENELEQERFSLSLSSCMSLYNFVF